MADKRAANENMLRNMKSQIETLKQEKVRTLKRMKEKETISREKEVARDQEINKLRRKERQMSEAAKKLERQNQMQVWIQVGECLV